MMLCCEGGWKLKYGKYELMIKIPEETRTYGIFHPKGRREPGNRKQLSQWRHFAEG